MVRLRSDRLQNTINAICRRPCRWARAESCLQSVESYFMSYSQCPRHCGCWFAFWFRHRLHKAAFDTRQCAAKAHSVTPSIMADGGRSLTPAKHRYTNFLRHSLFSAVVYSNSESDPDLFTITAAGRGAYLLLPLWPFAFQLLCVTYPRRRCCDGPVSRAVYAAPPRATTSLLFLALAASSMFPPVVGARCGYCPLLLRLFCGMGEV